MPELPEVETIRRDLEKSFLNRCLVSIDIFEPRLLQNCSQAELETALLDRALTAMNRRGKFLIFEFEGYSAVVHLRMSGWFSQEPATHTRMILNFEGDELYFDDTRRFGTLHLVKTDELANQPPLKSLGVEPLGPTFTQQAFSEIFSTTREVKRLLLDQTKIAGLGNIYVCEALHRARIHPQQRAHRISKKKIVALHGAIQVILQQAIDNHGSTLGDAVGDYRTLDGAQGSFQDRFQVYGREGERCFRCQSSIHRIVQAQRSTFFCPKCQLSYPKMNL